MFKLNTLWAPLRVIPIKASRGDPSPSYDPPPLPIWLCFDTEAFLLPPVFSSGIGFYRRPLRYRRPNGVLTDSPHGISVSLVLKGCVHMKRVLFAGRVRGVRYTRRKCVAGSNSKV